MPGDLIRVQTGKPGKCPLCRPVDVGRRQMSQVTLSSMLSCDQGQGLGGLELSLLTRGGWQRRQ